MRVSVIIPTHDDPTHNDAKGIGRVLAHVPAEVIVVDSNSTDGTTDLAPRIGADNLIQLRRDLRIVPRKAPRTATSFGEWEGTVAQLRRRWGQR